MRSAAAAAMKRGEHRRQFAATVTKALARHFPDIAARAAYTRTRGYQLIEAAIAAAPDPPTPGRKPYRVITLRLGIELHEAAKAAAKAIGTSLNAFGVAALEQATKDRRRHDQNPPTEKDPPR